jgi:hypothetical protein
MQRRFKTATDTHQTTRHHIPEDPNPQTLLWESRISHKLCIFFITETCCWVCCIENTGESASYSIWDSTRNNMWDNTTDSKWDSTRDNIWDSTRDNMWDNTTESLWESIKGNMWDKMWDNRRESKWDNTWDNICQAAVRQVRQNCNNTF